MMKIPDITIAIDGYSSTGKSTFAKLIAERFAFHYLDSGALYRAVTLYALEHSLFDARTGLRLPELLRGVEETDLHFEHSGGESRTCMGGRCVEREIRTLVVSNAVSPVAAVPEVRAFVDRKLREAGRGGRIVMDGRDIGTTVFPEAELKIFMVAGERIRARRRYEEMAAKGRKPDFEAVLKNVRERDYIDSHREVSPLKQAPDAIILDNSYLTVADQLCWLEMVVKNKFGS